LRGIRCLIISICEFSVYVCYNQSIGLWGENLDSVFTVSLLFMYVGLPLSIGLWGESELFNLNSSLTVCCLMRVSIGLWGESGLLLLVNVYLDVFITWHKV
jgi:hypothetical protein